LKIEYSELLAATVDLRLQPWLTRCLLSKDYAATLNI